MRVLTIVHQPDAGPGVFGDAARSAGWEVQTWPIATLAEPPGDPLGFDAVMSFGSAAHADQEERHPWLTPEKNLLSAMLAARIPLLGVCLGAQLVAEAAGLPPRRAAWPEIGWHPVELTPEGERDPVLGPLAPGFTAFGWHSYVCDLPPGATALARSAACLQAYRIGGHAWGIQFHPEVTEADVRHWIEDLGSDPDAVRAGVSAEGLRAQTAAHIEASNSLGRGLCRRFLEVAARWRPAARA